MSFFTTIKSVGYIALIEHTLGYSDNNAISPKH